MPLSLDGCTGVQIDRNFIPSVYAGIRKHSGILILTYKVAPWTLYSPLMPTPQIAIFAIARYFSPTVA